jgi:hypothetical protein
MTGLELDRDWLPLGEDTASQTGVRNIYDRVGIGAQGRDVHHQPVMQSACSP